MGDYMREIDLKNYEIHTDLVRDSIINKVKSVDEDIYEKYSIKVSHIRVNEKLAKILEKKEGDYTTIYFEDITDNTNYKHLKEILTSELKRMLEKEGVTKEKSVLIVGLGNEKSTPDALGPKTIEKVLATKHIFALTGSLEEGFSIVSKLAPGVMGTTGMETSDIIEGVIKKTLPDAIIVIDSLKSDSINRVCKTIQITNTGISPGSGIGNKRKELSYDTLKIPVIAIGIPMVVDAVTIVSDTTNFMLKHFSYNLKNKDNIKNKIIPSHMRNYLLDNDLKLSTQETNYFLGAFGTLSDFEKKALIFDVLTPIGYNLIVTPKEVDELIEKLGLLLGESLNIALHEHSSI